MTATYTLGEVTKTAQIPVTFIAGYEVNAKSFKNPDNDNSVNMNPVPETLDGEFDEKYKESGYICGTEGQSLKFSKQVRHLLRFQLRQRTIALLLFLFRIQSDGKNQNKRGKHAGLSHGRHERNARRRLRNGTCG